MNSLGGIAWLEQTLEDPAMPKGTVGGLLSDNFAFYYLLQDKSVSSGWSDLSREGVLQIADWLGIPDEGVYAALWEGSVPFRMNGTEIPLPPGPIGELNVGGDLSYRVYLVRDSEGLQDLVSAFEEQGQRSCPDIWWSAKGRWLVVSSHDLDSSYAASVNEVEPVQTPAFEIRPVSSSAALRPSH